MKKLKQIFLPFILGLVILAFMVVFMTQVSIDFRIVLIVCSMLFFLSGFLSAKKKLHSLIISVIIILPFTTVLNVLTYSQLPQLLWFTLFFIPAACLGVMIKRQNTFINYGYLGIFVFSMLFMSFFIVPNMLENQLSEEKNQEAEPYRIFDMQGNKIESTELKGKIVVLDFFGTWCKPCAQELIELNKVYEHFEEEKDIVFYVINSAEAGDTKEKMTMFINAHEYPFNFAFDLNRELVDQFDLHGVPYLFIYDKNGNLRYEHFGYNKGETNFVSSIIEIIESLE